METRVKAAWITGAVLLAAIGVAEAGLSKKVVKAFRGDILFTAEEVDFNAGNSDEETIAALKKQRAKVIKGEPNAEGVTTWHFHYTAFLKKAPGVTSLSFDFYLGGDYVANEKLMGIDPKITLLQGRFSLTEDDNLNKNRNYVVKLTGRVKGKERVFATTKVATK